MLLRREGKWRASDKLKRRDREVVREGGRGDSSWLESSNLLIDEAKFEIHCVNSGILRHWLEPCQSEEERNNRGRTFRTKSRYMRKERRKKQENERYPCYQIPCLHSRKSYGQCQRNS